jgi:mono/diheme cytochrome c family protein
MRRALPFAIALVAILAWPGAVAAGNADRGRLLYEAGCKGCHADSVHGREKRAATDFPSVRAWVRRWSANLGLSWTESDMDDVAAYLNVRYYRFACPPPDCKATGSREDGQPNLALDGRQR